MNIVRMEFSSVKISGYFPVRPTIFPIRAEKIPGSRVTCVTGILPQALEIMRYFREPTRP